MQRFLIIQTAFLGDVILITPVISELKRLYPTAEIDVVVRKGNESLLANNPKINQILIWNKQAGKYKNLISLIKTIRKKKYDEVLTFQRYSNAGLMTYFAKTKSRIGFDRNAFSWIYNQKHAHSLLAGNHEVERNLQLIAHHGAVALLRPELFPSKEDREKIAHLLGEDYYCMAPASVWETKKLPTAKWVELIQSTSAKGKIYLIGGPGDADLCQEIIQLANVPASNLAGKLSLLQSAALMEGAKMNFVNDSGPLHIASAMNAPTRAFFCSTIPQFGFGPLAENAKVIETKMELSCRPCTFHGKKECPLGHYKCGNSIDVSLENLEL